MPRASRSWLFSCAGELGAGGAFDEGRTGVRGRQSPDSQVPGTMQVCLPLLTVLPRFAQVSGIQVGQLRGFDSRDSDGVLFGCGALAYGKGGLVLIPWVCDVVAELNLLVSLGRRRVAQTISLQHLPHTHSPPSRHHLQSPISYLS